MKSQLTKARIAMVGLGWICVSLALHAQASDETFQLVSIRKVKSDGNPNVRPSMTALPGGRFEARQHSLLELAWVAYGFEIGDAQRGLADARDVPWASTLRFDITATADREWTAAPFGESMPGELRVMLRALLEDRFSLLARIEQRKFDVYALQLSKPVGGPGPQLRPSAGECLGPYTRPSRDRREAKPKCPFSVENDSVEAGAVTMAEVARVLSGVPALRSLFLERPVVDQTGLEGRYDVLLGSRSSIGRIQESIMPRGQDSPLPRSAFDEIQKRVILDAMEQQLGLKLKKANARLPTLVIRKARQPKED